MPAHGVLHGVHHGLVHGLHRTSLLGAFTGFGVITFTSNGVGIPNFNAAGLSDNTYLVSDTSGFAGCIMNRLYATSVTDPPTMIAVADETLRAYAAPPASNMGTEQTLGRRLFNRGMAASPYLATFALSGSSTLQQRGDSTSPIIGGNLCSRLIAYVLGRQAALLRPPDFTVMHTGENDTSTSLAANAVGANIANFAATYRAGIGQPTHPLFWVFNAATTGAFSSTVKAQIEAFVASDPYSRKVYVDDIPLAANPHYGANGQYDVGDRVCYAVQNYVSPGIDFNMEAPSAFPRLQDWGAAVNTAASPATAVPRSGPDLRVGDAQLLVVSSTATDPTYTLTTPAGFTALGSGKFQSIFGGTNFRSMIIYWRLVNATNGYSSTTGQITCPVIDAGTVANTEAFILTFRGPNPWVANPFDVFATGGNNANTTGLVVPGGTTAVANELAVLLSTLGTNSVTVTSMTNATLQNVIKQRQAGVATPASTLGIAVHTGRVPASGTVIASSTFVNSAANNNVGALVTIKP